jgi:Putative peptidoglycan binding domain
MNPYIKAQREQFAAELDDMQLRLVIGAMLVSEDEANPIPVFESLVNRRLYLASHGLERSFLQLISVDKYGHSVGPGFYGPANRGKLPQFMRVLGTNYVMRGHMNAAIDITMAGSDLIEGHTDQGLPSDPGGGYELAHSHVMINGEVFGDWGGGPGGYQGAAAWREEFEAEATKALQVALNNQGITLAVDGIFGPDTLKAVRTFQHDQGLVVDGIVGPDTWAKLA